MSALGTLRRAARVVLLHVDDLLGFAPQFDPTVCSECGEDNTDGEDGMCRRCWITDVFDSYYRRGRYADPGQPPYEPPF